NRFGGFGYVFGIRAEKLNADRPLDLIEVEIFPGPLVPAKNSFGGNEFGGEHVRAVFLAELAKNLVRDPGHRREIKRETVLEPGQRVHESILSQYGLLCRVDRKQEARHFPLPCSGED